jgi:23S rRNA pseudouridine1911/1915/1917 synthase
MDKLSKEKKKISLTPEIIFENDDYLVLNKPAGLIVHGDGKSDEKTLVDWLLKKYPEIEDVGESIEIENGEDILRSGIVHRIDKETSGILLVAKTQEVFEFFKEKFKNREINKTYFAYVYGVPRDERGIIDVPIGRSTSGVRKWETGMKARGEKRDAITKYKILSKSKGVSLLEIWPMTGRTHQIRVHLKSIGHPIVCDALYAPTKRPVLGFRRLALHASRLIFRDMEGREKIYEAPVPPDFKSALKESGYELRK